MGYFAWLDPVVDLADVTWSRVSISARFTTGLTKSYFFVIKNQIPQNNK